MVKKKIISESIEEKIAFHEKAIEQIKERQQEFEESNTFRLVTNTAYLQNTKTFEGWDNFCEWLEIKHEQHWAKMNDSSVEVTLK